MKKRILFYISIFFFLISIFSYYRYSSKEDLAFDTFCQNILADQLKVNSLLLHFNYVNPDEVNIPSSPVKLPLYSKKTVQNEYKLYKSYLDSLRKTQYDHLSTSEKDCFLILKYCFENDLKAKKYFYFQKPFSPSSGLQLEFPLLMAEYKFYSKKDVNHYFDLLKLFPLYLDSYINLEMERVEKGFGMPDFTIQKLITQCDQFIDGLIQKPKEHFLVSEFARKLVTLVESGAITEDEYHFYKKKNFKILTETFLPSYQKLKKDLATMLGQSKNNEGLCHFKNGKEYYEFLFKSLTNSDAKVENVYENISRLYYNYSHQLQREYQSFIKNNRLSQKEIDFFPFENPEEMLKHLYSQMGSDFPPLNSELSPTKQLRIKYVSDCLQNYTAPAYYVLPPLDYSSVNSIYINPKELDKGFSLYSTLAHEGFPGHLYQTNFFANYRKQKQIADIRGYINFPGYAEGWAVYTEFLSYDYAAKLLVEKTGKKEYSKLLNIYKFDKESSLALLSLLDIAIHYYGIDYNRVEELLSAHGINDSHTQREIYEYILEEPCNYLKYYWGYQEMLNLKKEMKEMQSGLYTEYGFHKFILESGPCPFPILRNKLHSLK